MQNGQINDTYLYNVRHGFCHDLMAIVRKWYEIHGQDQSVARNVRHLVRYRPEGMLAYIGGRRVIA